MCRSEKWGKLRFYEPCEKDINRTSKSFHTKLTAHLKKNTIFRIKKDFFDQNYVFEIQRFTKQIK